MYCWKCGKENHDDSRFCVSCGAELRKAAQGTAASAPAAQMPAQSAPAQTKGSQKSGRWTYFLVAAIAIIVSIVNINDMNAGESYTVLFGAIPIQYVMIPAGVICLIMGLRETSKK